MEKNSLERYFKNTCTPEERGQVEAWLSASGKACKSEADIARFWDEFDAEATRIAENADLAAEGAPKFEKVWANISEEGKRIEQDMEITRVFPVESRSRRMRNWRRLIAAACIGFLLTLGALFINKQYVQRDAFADYVTVETNKGERKWVTLSDGSEVLLNAESRLRYPKSRDIHQTAIYIEGEAFFNMTESEKPRVIKAGNLETWTGERSQINISAFPTDSTVTVAVNQGNAEIRDGNGQMLKLQIDQQPQKLATPTDSIIPLIKLRPAVAMKVRDFAVIDKQRRGVKVSESIDERKAFGWKDGILYFESASTDEVISRIERWYGVNVDVCETGLQVKEYSGVFENADLALVLSQIGQSTPLNFQIVGETVYLCGK